MVGVECVARGYLAGSGVLDYEANGFGLWRAARRPACEEGHVLPEAILLRRRRRRRSESTTGR